MKKLSQSVIKFDEKDLDDFNHKDMRLIENKHSKNIEIINTYGKNYVNFFCERITDMPMFLDTSCPRALKRVAMVKDFIINSGEKIGIYYNPFNSRGYLQKFSFADSGVDIETLDKLSNYLKNYSSFKIVCTYIKLVQQSILNMSDGYGTTIDAIIAPSTFDPTTYGENPNNIKVSFFNRMNTIDGRKGVKGMIVGTPEQPNNYPSSSNQTMNDTNMVAGSCYIPYGTPIKYIGHPGTTARLIYSDDTYFDFSTFIEIQKPVVAVTNINAGCGVFASRIPNESIFYARISTPSSPISYRVYAEAIVEVIPTGNLLEEIPMFTPPTNYSTIRIKQAFQQSFPSLIQGSYIEKYKNDNFSDPYKFMKRVDDDDKKYYASDLNAKPKRLKLISKNKENKIIITPRYVLDACAYLNTNIYENISGTEYTKLMRGSIQKMADINFQFFPIISNDNVELSILTYKKLEKFDNKNEDEILDLVLYDEEGNEKATRISIKTNDYCNLKIFKEKVSYIIRYLNSTLYFPFPEFIEISIFSKEKFEGESFTLALIALLSGSPCGNVCTGNVKFKYEKDEIVYEIEPNDEKAIQNKSMICTSDNPLITCGDYPAGMIALTSGVNVSPFENYNIITCKTIEELVAYLFIPPKIRNYKYNYFVKYANEIKSHLLNKNKDYFSLLAYLVQYASQDEIDQFIKTQKYNIEPNYFNKLKSSNYSTYIVLNKGKNYLDVNQIIDSEPQLLSYINRNPIIIDGRKYLPQGRLMSYLVDNNLLDSYKKKTTTSVIEKIKEAIAAKKELDIDSVLESIKQFKNLFKDNVNTENLKLIRKQIIKDSNPFEKYKDNIEEISKQIKKDIAFMNKFTTGKHKLISNLDVAAVWSDLGGKNAFKKEDLEKIRAQDNIPQTIKILDIMIKSQKFKTAKIKAALDKLKLPLKSKGTNPAITSQELEAFIELFNNNLTQEIEDKEESKYIEDDLLNQTHQILNEDEIDQAFN
jgi:hypothetical protein